ncbi:MAG: 2-hydroxyacid dehydrogenase [Firmicutes bacterium]|nr:2-hydroxyacid dehydrogenase [Bacillota bacterium]
MEFVMIGSGARMKPECLITAAFSQEGIELLESLVQIRLGGWGVTRRKLTPEEMISEIGGARIVITELDPVDANVLAAHPNLLVVGCCRGNPVNVDVAAATRLGIPILYTPGRNAVSVAEMTIALMISAARNLLKASSSLMAGQWGVDGLSPYLAFRGIELNSRVVGLVGFGAVGREVAARLVPFGVRLLVYDPYVAQDVLERYGAESVSLEELCQRADFISVHCKVTQETKGLISRKHFDMMKPGAYFINTARAAITDEEALIEALRDRRIAGAALDVFGQEPLDPSSPLLRLDNVTLTPHIGGATHDVVRHHSQIIAEDIIRYLRGERPRYVANPEVLVERE